MTKKRFWCLERYAGETSPIVDEKFTPTNGWICDKLNELYEENRELKRELRKCKNNKLFSRRELERENKELKEQLKDCTKKVKEEIRKQAEDDAIRWANIGR